MKTQDKPIETEEQYRQELASHDWWSAKSDDYSVYQEGQINLGRLYQASLKFDPDLTIWTKLYLENMPAKRHQPADVLIHDMLKAIWPCAKKGSGT